MQVFRKPLKPAIFVYFAFRALNGAFTITTLAVFSRVLSQVECGIYALGIAITAIISGVLFQSINTTVGRFLPAHYDDPSKVLDIAAIGFWGASAATAIIFFSISFSMVFGFEHLTLFILFLITIGLGRHTLELQLANALNNALKFGMLLLAKNCVALIAGYLLIIFWAGQSSALLGFFLGLLFAIFAFASNPFLRTTNNAINLPLASKMCGFYAPLIFNNLSLALVELADQFLIASLLGVANVAPYALGYSFVQQTIGPIMNVLFLADISLILNAFETKNINLVNSRLYALGTKLISIGLPTSVLIGFLAGDISIVLFNNNYQNEIAGIIPWISAAILVGGFKSYFLDVAFQFTFATKLQATIALLMAIINVLLNLLLLPRFGIIASAWATLLSFTLGAFLSWFLGRSLVEFPSLYKIFIKCAIACTTMVIFLSFLSSFSGWIWLIAKFVIGFLIYSAIALILNIADSQRFMRLLVRRYIF